MDFKFVFKILFKVFGYVDKNVRVEVMGLVVEFYWWLCEVMKLMFWGDFKLI